MGETAGQPDERFSALYAEHIGSLVAYCRRKVGATEAEEIAHEAFLRAWASWDNYSPSRPFWPWLVTIARRVCIDRGRRERTAAALAHKTISIFDGIPVTRPDEIVETTEEYRWARTAVAGLRPEQRRMLTRQAVDGWSYAEIASAEGISEDAVRGVLRRARDRVRAAYAGLAGSAPVALPLAAFRWVRKRAATMPTFDLNMIRAGEAAFAAAAALAIGAGPAASAPAPAVLPANRLVLVSRPAEAPPQGPTAPAVHHGRTTTQQTATTLPTSGARPQATALPARPTKVKVTELNPPDDEVARRCEGADVKFRVADHGACVNTKGVVESAEVAVETGNIEP